jgi:hypothetical protein
LTGHGRSIADEFAAQLLGTDVLVGVTMVDHAAG